MVLGRALHDLSHLLSDGYQEWGAFAFRKFCPCQAPRKTGRTAAPFGAVNFDPTTEHHAQSETSAGDRPRGLQRYRVHPANLPNWGGSLDPTFTSSKPLLASSQSSSRRSNSGMPEGVDHKLTFSFSLCDTLCCALSTDKNHERRLPASPHCGIFKLKQTTEATCGCRVGGHAP